MLAKWIRLGRPSPPGMGASPLRGSPSQANLFPLLFHAHKHFVGRIARRAGVPFDDVPDVVQKVFLDLHEAMKRGLDTGAPLHGWLRAVTFRTARDYLRLAHHEREVLSTTGSVETADMAPNPEESMVKIDVHRLVDGVLDMLPPEQRIVLAMSDIEEMAGREIAEVLAIPEGTVYTRIRAARRAFEAAWNERRGTGNAAVMPFALWGASDLLHAARPTPDMPAEMMDEVWRRLVDALGPSIVGAGAAGAAGGALASGAAKSGAVLTAKQAAIGAVAAVLVGAGLHALLAPMFDKLREPEEITVAHDKPPAAAIVAVATASVTTAEPVASAVAVAPRAVVDAGAAPAGEGFERTWLKNARDFYERGEFAAARGALARVKGPHLAREREELRALILAQMDGGSR